MHILEFLENKKNLIDEKIKKARKIMPELEMLGRLTSERTKVKFFEGKEGLSLIQKDVMKSLIKKKLDLTNKNIYKTQDNDNDTNGSNDNFIIIIHIRQTEKKINLQIT